MVAVTPAHAAATGGTIHPEVMLAEAQRVATEAGVAAVAYWQRLMAGDMAAIQIATWLFSGLTSLIAIRLLICRPRALPAAVELYAPELTPEAVKVEPAEADVAPEDERPKRLLEAIAAAKAQMAISAAERRHVR